MINENELKSEKKYLNGVVDVIDNDLKEIDNNIFDRERVLNKASEFASDSFNEVDVEEQSVMKQMMAEMQLDIENLLHLRELRNRQRQSAYFGRIDFKADDEKEVNPYYIGISHILDKHFPLPLVLDWRAPLSSMYYDYELGRSKYSAPMGDIKGKIYLKRQYKTNNKKLVYAFDSNITIGDEILRQTLAGSADSKMKNIVATIQAEQNKIIRSDEGKNLLVQGVAGSGKTSIALHRVAYLLYKNKISAKDILIISPSSLFSDYISNVLPELGEQNTPKITFDEIAREEFGTLVFFEPKSQMLEDILQNKNVVRAKEIEIKASFEFFHALQKFLHEKVSVSFNAVDIKLGKQKILASEISKLYNENYKTKNPSIRIEWIADYLVDKIGVNKSSEQSLFNRLKRILFDMFENTDIVNIYSKFLKSQKMEFVNVQVGKQTFARYEDVPALLYIKDYLLGITPQKHFKHIIIDEMQDYSPISLDLLNKIYPANKTYLGDINQTFEKNLDEKYLKNLVKLIGNTKLLLLNTTYRSTRQIAEHNQAIIKLKNVNNFNREGHKVKAFKKTNKLKERLEKVVATLAEKFNSIAIITPSIKDANEINAILPNKFKFTLIDEASGEAKEKKVIVPVIYSKGLEFDAVVFVNSSYDEIKTGTHNRTLSGIAKHIKYISCTRALHELVVIE